HPCLGELLLSPACLYLLSCWPWACRGGISSGGTSLSRSCPTSTESPAAQSSRAWGSQTSNSTTRWRPAQAANSVSSCTTHIRPGTRRPRTRKLGSCSGTERAIMSRCGCTRSTASGLFWIHAVGKKESFSDSEEKEIGSHFKITPDLLLTQLGLQRLGEPTT